MNVLQVQGQKHEYETLGVGMVGRVPRVENGPPRAVLCGDMCAHWALNNFLQYVLMGVQFGFWAVRMSLSWLLTDLSSTCTLVRQIMLTEPIPQRAKLIKLAAP